MSKFVPDRLRKAADIYAERNKLYGDNYKRFGRVMLPLMEHVDMTMNEQDWNRLGILVQIVAKLTRYCANFRAGGHADSLDDLAVYAMMLQELDSERCPF